MKKGLSALAIILLVIIVIVFTAIIITLTASYIKSKFLENNNTINNSVINNSNSTDKDLSYYLPADYAAIRVTRGYYEANVTGVLISFKDDSETYEYNSTEYPGIEGISTYTILKDQLFPKVPADWDFTRVKSVSLRYMLGNGKPSAIIKTVNINPDKISNGFGEKCSSYTEDGQEKVSCE